MTKAICRKSQFLRGMSISLMSYRPDPRSTAIQASITAMTFNATMAKLNVKVGNNNLKAEMPAELAKEMDLMIGKEVYVILKLRRLKVLGQ